ncbi:MAG: hypothetical protein ACI9AR_000250 [Flavobacteriaceae bacterium]|jgi:hypothetical protein
MKKLVFLVVCMCAFYAQAQPNFNIDVVKSEKIDTTYAVSDSLHIRTISVVESEKAIENANDEYFHKLEYLYSLTKSRRDIVPFRENISWEQSDSLERGLLNEVSYIKDDTTEIIHPIYLFMSATQRTKVTHTKKDIKEEFIRDEYLWNWWTTLILIAILCLLYYSFEDKSKSQRTTVSLGDYFSINDNKFFILIFLQFLTILILYYLDCFLFPYYEEFLVFDVFSKVLVLLIFIVALCLGQFFLKSTLDKSNISSILFTCGVFHITNCLSVVNNNFLSYISIPIYIATLYFIGNYISWKYAMKKLSKKKEKDSLEEEIG